MCTSEIRIEARESAIGGAYSWTPLCRGIRQRSRVAMERGAVTISERLSWMRPVLYAVMLALLPGTALSQNTTHSPAGETPMPQKILVHITHGPEHPTRAALGFAVAKAALDEGHSVSLFLAGDAVQLIREGVLQSLAGLGTGNLRELYDGIVAGGARFYLSGGSSSARGVTEEDLRGKPAEFAGPPQLVRLSLDHDRMFTY